MRTKVWGQVTNAQFPNGIEVTGPQDAAITFDQSQDASVLIRDPRRIAIGIVVQREQIAGKYVAILWLQSYRLFIVMATLRLLSLVPEEQSRLLCTSPQFGSISNARRRKLTA